MPSIDSIRPARRRGEPTMRQVHEAWSAVQASDPDLLLRERWLGAVVDELEKCDFRELVEALGVEGLDQRLLLAAARGELQAAHEESIRRVQEQLRPGW